MDLWNLLRCGDALVAFLKMDDVLALRVTSRLAVGICSGRVAATTLEFRRVFTSPRRRQVADNEVFLLWRRHVTLYNLLTESAYNGASARLIVKYLRGERCRSSSHSYRMFVRQVRAEPTCTIFLPQRTCVELDSGWLPTRDVEWVQLWKLVAQRVLARVHCCPYCNRELFLRLSNFAKFLTQPLSTS